MHQVVFKKPVSLKEHPKVNEWLTCVESEMRTTLATLLAAAVTDVQQFNSESIDGQQYMKWVDGYQVSRMLYLIHMYMYMYRYLYCVSRRSSELSKQHAAPLDLNLHNHDRALVGRG